MSAKIDAGGWAFPVGFHPEGNTADQNGMTLRDWFAGQAMTMISESCFEANSTHSIATLAYEQADAMIAARGGAK